MRHGYTGLCSSSPFVDGNGRVARLVQDYVLLKNNYVPASVQPEDRERNYYEALEGADLGDGEDFLEIVAKTFSEHPKGTFR